MAFIKRVKSTITKKKDKERLLRWRIKNKEKCKVTSRKNYIKNLSLRIFDRIKFRANRDNISFNLTPEDIVIPEYCPVLGIKLEVGKEFSKECSPSVDRCNPELGYVKGNISIISMKANQIKTYATSEEILKVGYWLQSIENKGKSYSARQV